MGNVLVFAEHQKGKFPKSTLIAIQAGKEAASKLGGNCLAAVLGSGVDSLAQEIAGYGVAKVLAADDPALANYLADAYAAAGAASLYQGIFVGQKDLREAIWVALPFIPPAVIMLMYH